MKKNTLDLNILSKVRDLPGFPKAEDSDIISLSDPPHYTACPNPFLEDFIKENSTPYDPKKDQHHKEPFTSDLFGGKNHPVYNAHAYHTKVPHQVIMKCILHYTQPGDVVYDGFCGTGMTGVASFLCGFPELELKKQIEEKYNYVILQKSLIFLHQLQKQLYTSLESHQIRVFSSLPKENQHMMYQTILQHYHHQDILKHLRYNAN